jgi:hypothetical protein
LHLSDVLCLPQFPLQLFRIFSFFTSILFFSYSSVIVLIFFTLIEERRLEGFFFKEPFLEFFLFGDIDDFVDNDDIGGVPTTQTTGKSPKRKNSRKGSLKKKPSRRRSSIKVKKIKTITEE